MVRARLIDGNEGELDDGFTDLLDMPFFRANGTKFVARTFDIGANVPITSQFVTVKGGDQGFVVGFYEATKCHFVVAYMLGHKQFVVLTRNVIDPIRTSRTTSSQEAPKE